MSLLPSTSAAVCYGPNDLRIDQRPLWPPAPGEATVHITHTSLCGSDLHYFAHGRNGDFALQAPLVLGHEAAGIVTALGPPLPTLVPSSTSPTAAPHLHAASSGVQQRLKIGMRVAVECGVYCGQCTLCRTGRYNLCKHMRFCSSAKTFPHLDGTLQTEMNHPVHLLHPIPDNVTLEQAALAEPLSVLIHASRRTGISPPAPTPSPSLSTPSTPTPTPSATSTPTPTQTATNAALRASNASKSVLVFGTGAIGLLACALAKARGVRKVVALDINPRRLAFARSAGWADDVFCLAAPPSSASSSPLSPSLPASTTTSSAASSSTSSASSSGAASPPQPQTETDDKDKRRTDPEDKLRRARENINAALKHFGEPDGFDVVYECSGAEACIQMSVHACTPGGKVMLIGMGSPTVTLPLGAAACREVDLLGSFRYSATYGEALGLLSEAASVSSSSASSSSAASAGASTSTTASSAASPTTQDRAGAQTREDGAQEETREEDGEREGILRGIERLVTHRYGLAETRKAFEVMQRGQDEHGGLVIKVMVEA